MFLYLLRWPLLPNLFFGHDPYISFSDHIDRDLFRCSSVHCHSTDDLFGRVPRLPSTLTHYTLYSIYFSLTPLLFLWISAIICCMPSNRDLSINFYNIFHWQDVIKYTLKYIWWIVIFFIYGHELYLIKIIFFVLRFWSHFNTLISNCKLINSADLNVSRLK